MSKPHMGSPSARRFVRQAAVRFARDPQVVALQRRQEAMAKSTSERRRMALEYLRKRPRHTDGKATATVAAMAEALGWGETLAKSILDGLAGETGSGVQALGGKATPNVFVFNPEAPGAKPEPAKAKREVKNRGARQYWTGYVLEQPAGAYLVAQKLAKESGMPHNTVADSMRWICRNMPGELVQHGPGLYEVLKDPKDAPAAAAVPPEQQLLPAPSSLPQVPDMEGADLDGLAQEEEFWPSIALAREPVPWQRPSSGLRIDWEAVVEEFGWPECWFKRVATSSGLVLAEDGAGGVYELRKLN